MVSVKPTRGLKYWYHVSSKDLVKVRKRENQETVFYYDIKDKKLVLDTGFWDYS